MASAQRKGKTVIKPPRKLGPDFSAEETWKALSHNIREIQKQNAANLFFEENHRYAYNMVLYKHGAALYDGVCALVAEHLDALAESRLVSAFPSGAPADPTQECQEGEMLMRALRSVWDDHASAMLKLGQILKYMDRVYTRTADVPQTWDAGLELFLKHIIRPPIKDHLVGTILRLIHLEREGHPINRSAVKGCVSVLIPLSVAPNGPTVYKKDTVPRVLGDDLTVYKRDIEPRFLAESEKFYRSEGERLLQTCNASEFLQKVEHRFQSEDERTNHYLSPQTTAPLRRILENNLLTPHLPTVINMNNSGLDVMIDTDNVSDIARLCRLSVMVPEGLPCLRSALKQSIAKRGGEVNRASLGGPDNGDDAVDVVGDGGDVPLKSTKQKHRPPTSASQTLILALKWVQDVLDMKDKFDRILKKSLQTNRDLESGINEAFESFINLNTKAPEYISLFIDDNLKKGLKGKSDHEMEVVLDKSITVFRYLTDKDVFERYYKGHLAKRLLGARSISDDAERGMLAKFKVECGYQFTQKLEGMFHDVKLSSDIMQAYRNHLTVALPIEISVTVLTSTFWPISHPSTTCTMPSEIYKSCRSFEQFYFSRHSGRRLTWQPSLGNADVRVTFKARTHDLNVSTYALVILLQFENLAEDEFLTYEELKVATAIADNELQRHLQSLACAKFKILKKHPPGRDVDPSDSFSFNHNFTSSLQKIKINTIASRVETADERKETLDRVDEERRHQTEACIVRIMKDRKHMNHNDLVNETTRQLAGRFQPNPLTIKKRIEGLIERDYLERCKDRKSYNYMA